MTSFSMYLPKKWQRENSPFTHHVPNRDKQNKHMHAHTYCEQTTGRSLETSPKTFENPYSPWYPWLIPLGPNTSWKGIWMHLTPKILPLNASRGYMLGSQRSSKLETRFPKNKPNKTSPCRLRAFRSTFSTSSLLATCSTLMTAASQNVAWKTAWGP